MKAKDILQLYQAGERDFKYLNLRGQSFRKANLAGADFSYADIRGANFAEANLTEAKFIKARAGLQKTSAIILLIFALLLTALPAFVAGFASAFLGLIFSIPVVEYTIGGSVGMVILGFCYFVLFRLGINSLFSIVLAVALAITLTVTSYISSYVASYVAVTVAPVMVLYMVSYIGLSITLTVVPALVVAVVSYVSVSLALTVTPAVVFTTGFYALSYVGLSILSYIALSADGPFTSTAIATATVFSLIALALNIYLAYRAYRGDQRDAWVRNIGLVIGAVGGTNFSAANLTNANFSQAILKHTNFRNAIKYIV